MPDTPVTAPPSFFAHHRNAVLEASLHAVAMLVLHLTDKRLTRGEVKQYVDQVRALLEVHDALP